MEIEIKKLLKDMLICVENIDAYIGKNKQLNSLNWNCCRFLQ